MCLCFCVDIDKIWVEKTFLNKNIVKSPKHDFDNFFKPPLPLTQVGNLEVTLCR